MTKNLKYDGVTRQIGRTATDYLIEEQIVALHPNAGNIRCRQIYLLQVAKKCMRQDITRLTDSQTDTYVGRTRSQLQTVFLGKFYTSTNLKNEETLLSVFSA